MSIEIGVNLEFIRCEDKDFETGSSPGRPDRLQMVEPLVHTGANC